MNSFGIIGIIYNAEMANKIIKKGRTRVTLLIVMIILALVANTVFQIFLMIDTNQKMSNVLYFPHSALWVLFYKLTSLFQ